MSPIGSPRDTAPADADPGLSAARAHLFNAGSVERFRDVLARGVNRIADRVADADQPFTGVTPDALAPLIAGVDLDRPLGDTDAALDELHDVWLRDAVWFHHPRYLAHLNCPVVIPALLGEAVLSAVNSSVDTWDQSVGATLMERHLIEWTAGRIGLGTTADGVFTSGGTQSNLQAMLLAREEACRRVVGGAATRPARPQVLARLRIITSVAGHFSVQKAAKLLGLGADAVLTVPTDAGRRMRTDDLATTIDRCRRDGLVVMAVVATAGTTDFGTIDPLPEIADICTAAGVWLHVDAAYGCGLLVSPTRRHLLDGIERADSVTVDYHKSFFQPVSSSALLVRDGRVLRHATWHADYLNPVRAVEQGIPNQVDKSIQTTRRFDAGKLWLTLRIMGPDAIGALFDRVVDLAAEAWRLLDTDPRFEVAARPQLSTVVFRHVPPDAGPSLVDDANLHARDALATSGAALVAGTKVDGAHYLKLTLLNPETTIDDIAAVLNLIADHAAWYAQTTATAELTCPVG
ncbi:aspartate aminotransferase family protein [Micromonospora sp. WMMA1363]|uniref:pyridoxal phosphate-dependent decarboxylase family protein n=1 Tax=Micromonospora sp. WMMA1363 TaxID=3053985 RepID=UPI00259CC0A1|nr:aspartate aminotransferase family protein [Micromonospora sp. WMMA1363]MDM4719547.1 aspartate aminotransferase family protein [Micromonospora sp. WMMA1363]